MRRCLRDPTFSRFDTIPECDGHTDTQTHDDGIYTALSKASRGKKRNEILEAALGDVVVVPATASAMVTD